MPFLVKQPSVLSRVLCESQCPPHNVIHDISQYDIFYDPLYSPTLFHSEQSVCDWLLHDVGNHSLSSCSTCSSSFDVVINVTYSFAFFQIDFENHQFSIPVSYVESSLFSFCRLHKRLLKLVDGDNENVDAPFILQQLPVWLMRESSSFYLCLSSLSLPLLQDVIRLLGCRCSYLCQKVPVMEVILKDLMH